MTEETRCMALKVQSPGAALFGPILGAVADGNRPKVELRCMGEAGHKGKHWAYVQPFPGFASERVSWGETPA